MYVNKPLISYYPADDSKFIDEMYVPYQKHKIPIRGDGCYIKLNSWAKLPCPELVDPSQLRIDWGLDFLRVHPQDPCPGGWTDIGNGFCRKMDIESYQGNFYTKDTFDVAYQDTYSYTVDPRSTEQIDRLKAQDTAPTFQKRSVNPNTGHYVQYYNEIPPSGGNVYGKLPTRFGYLGI